MLVSPAMTGRLTGAAAPMGLASAMDTPPRTAGCPGSIWDRPPAISSACCSTLA